MNKDDITIKINLYDTVIEKEQSEKKQIDVREAMLDFCDDILQKRSDLTEEQQGKIARVRARIAIELSDF